MRKYKVMSSATVYWKNEIQAENMLDAKNKIMNGEEEIGNITDSDNFEIIRTFFAEIDMLDTNNKYCSNCGTLLSTTPPIEAICPLCKHEINEWRRNKL